MLYQVGFVLGPTFWGDQNPLLKALYPIKSFYVNETFALFGCLLFLFVTGAKMDLGMVRRTGKKAVAIGILTFLVPLVLNLIVANILSSKMEMEPNLQKALFIIAVHQSSSTFHVIVCLLADLKLLNSELGQLASSSSMISGACSWVMAIWIFTTRQSILGTYDSLIWMFFSLGFMLILIVLLLRPIMTWMIDNTPEGKPIKEGYVVSIFVMLLGCVFFSEFIGQHIMFGAIALGMAVPDGPPLGAAVVAKLESFSSSILLPSYFVFTLSGVNVLSMHSRTVTVVCIFGLTSHIGKILGAMLPSLYCKMPPMDAFSLGLIMSSQGITDVLLLQHSLFLFVRTSSLITTINVSMLVFCGHAFTCLCFLLLQLIDNQIYSIMILAMVVLSGIFTPIIKLLYNPSKQYSSCNKRTIQHSSPDAEFRMLVCIYHQDSTPSMKSLLEVSNPTARSPICCYVVHLTELAGRLSPLLVYHKPDKREDFHSHCSSHIINAFRLYEEHSNGHVMVNLFTAISPYATIHEEVCRLALEKRTSLVIIPFHKQWRFHGLQEFAELRSVNRHILAKAPCSIGILIDRGTLGGSSITNSNSLYNIGIIFVHGRDDREALAYAMRMAGHPNVGITVIHLINPGQQSKNSLDMELDREIIDEFRGATFGKKHHFYKKEVLEDSIELVRVIRSLENSYDLILVGRHHESHSPMFMGLSDWNEFPELGFIGDMLAASDSCCEVSVLVVQQQKLGGQERTGSIKYLMEDSTEVTHILQDYDNERPFVTEKINDEI